MNPKDKKVFDKQLLPSGQFHVYSAKIGSTASFERYFGRNRSPIPLEDLNDYSLVHLDLTPKKDEQTPKKSYKLRFLDRNFSEPESSDQLEAKKPCVKSLTK